MNNSISTILSQPEARSRVLERVNTTNGKLTIEETDEYRWIRDNHKAYYSILDKSQPERLVLPYLESMMAVLLFLPEPESVLLLGAGGGAILRFLNEYFTDNCTLAIDYDENVIKITEKYFLNDNFTQNSIMNIDAIQYISKPSINKFDLMFVDLLERFLIFLM